MTNPGLLKKNNQLFQSKKIIIYALDLTLTKFSIDNHSEGDVN